MDRSENNRAVMVGIFIAVGLVIFIIGVLTYGSQKKSFSNGIHISAVFDDVNGLMKGNNIWFSGVRVGTISTIKFVGISQVYVTMNIDKTAQPYIHRNAGVRVSSEGFIGNKIIVIDGGSPNAPVIEEGDRLKAEKLMSTDDIMKTLQQNNQNLLAITSDFKQLSHKIVSGKGVVGELMADSDMAVRFRTIVANLQSATNSTAHMANQLQQYTVKLNNPNGFANKVVTDTATFRHLEQAVNQIKKATTTVSGFADNLNQASKKLNSTDNALGVLLNDQKAAVKMQSTINNLQESSVKLNEDLEAAQHNFLLKGFFKKKAKQQADSLKKATGH